MIDYAMVANARRVPPLAEAHQAAEEAGDQ